MFCAVDDLEDVDAPAVAASCGPVAGVAVDLPVGVVVTGGVPVAAELRDVGVHHRVRVPLGLARSPGSTRVAAGAEVDRLLARLPLDRVAGAGEQVPRSSRRRRRRPPPCGRRGRRGRSPTCAFSAAVERGQPRLRPGVAPQRRARVVVGLGRVGSPRKCEAWYSGVRAAGRVARGVAARAQRLAERRLAQQRDVVRSRAAAPRPGVVRPVADARSAAPRRSPYRRRRDAAAQHPCPATADRVVVAGDAARGTPRRSRGAVGGRRSSGVPAPGAVGGVAGRAEQPRAGRRRRSGQPRGLRDLDDAPLAVGASSSTGW